MALLATAGAALAEAPRIAVARMILVDPGGEVPIGAQVLDLTTPGDPVYLRITGLVASMRLTEGQRINDRAWAIPLQGLSRLRLVAPQDLPDRQQIRLALMALDGTELAVATTEIYRADAVLGTVAAAASAPTADGSQEGAAVEAPAPVRAMRAAPVDTSAEPAPVPLTPRGTTTTALPPPAPEPAPQAAPTPELPRVLSDNQRATAQRMLARGQGLFAEGKIVEARLFFERAADIGLAEGALALGATYDPRELAARRVVGVTPDVGRARKWYEHAVALGSPGARERLARLAP